MAWCPVCKCEYKEGILKCAECKVDLVDSLEEKNEEAPILEEELSEEIISELAKELNEDEKIHITEEEEVPNVRNVKQTSVYRNSKELSIDNKSSAYILLPIGLVGIVLLFLVWIDVIPLYTKIISKLITTVLMGSTFVVFIVMGYISLKKGIEYDKKAVKEGDLTKEILKYFENNFTAEAIDENVGVSQLSELEDEEKYFKRVDCIKELITKQFMNLEDNYIEYMSDEIYTMLYEE